MNQQKNLLSYWRTCLFQGMRAEIDVEHSQIFLPEENLWETAVLAEGFVEALFEKEEKRLNSEKGIRSPQDPKWERPEYLLLWWSAFYVLPQDPWFSKPIYPFWMPVRLQRTGHLLVPEACSPIIPREWMSPVGWEEGDYIFCKLADYETCLDWRPEHSTWESYTVFIEKIFSQLTQQSIQNFTDTNYPIVHQHTLIIPDKESQAASALLALYDYLIATTELPLLLSNGLSPTTPSTTPAIRLSQFMDFQSVHLGQMSHQFALSLTQRQALYTLQKLEHGQVFALSGPPGTGKTTFLQSVVANEVVNAALKGQTPTLLLACAATNQAVTNIQESFMATTTTDDDFRGRWIPDFMGYATYLSARNKPEKELQGINYVKADESGTFAKLENEAYVAKAEKYYLRMAGNYLQKSVVEVSEAYFLLQKEIRALQKGLQEGQKIWGAVVEEIRHFEKDFVETSYHHTLALEYAFWLNFQTSIEEQLYLIKASARPSIRQSILKLDSLEDTSRKGLMQFFSDVLTAVVHINLAWKNWNRWRKKWGIRSNPMLEDTALWEAERAKVEQPKSGAYFFDELDLSLRNKAFYLAIHYWEGRWIESMQEQLDGDAPNRGKHGRTTTWQTRAMLSPCFVSTFFMAPKFFSYHKYIGEHAEGHKLWENPPLTDLIDYLIVDEAGQASPEIGVPVFALAKKALVVGDTQQIEPVWKIVPKVDIGNLIHYQLLSDAKDKRLQEWQNQGFLASSGSLMKMALQLTPIIDTHNLQQPKGMMLLEHRRCHERIINFCNELAYGGMLRPMKSQPQGGQLFPPMLFLPHGGVSAVEGKDRFNPSEAQAIVQWLLHERSRIENHFSRLYHKTTSIESLVGIITPFRGQRRLLYKLLREAGFDTHAMKLGTVHALQGAEREIILFSPVYSAGDVKVMFFDRHNRPNMLNVAVSRAKQSFVIIGTPQIFVDNPQTPSGKLSLYLKNLNDLR